MKDLLETPAQQEAAVANFQAMVATPGWRLFTQIVNANIEVLEKQILEDDEIDDVGELRRLRDKLKAHKDILETPYNVIKTFAPPEEGEIVEEKNPDPYPTREEVEAQNVKAKEEREKEVEQKPEMS